MIAWTNDSLRVKAHCGVKIMTDWAQFFFFFRITDSIFFFFFFLKKKIFLWEHFVQTQRIQILFDFKFFFRPFNCNLGGVFLSLKKIKKKKKEKNYFVLHFQSQIFLDKVCRDIHSNWKFCQRCWCNHYNAHVSFVYWYQNTR